MFLSQLKLAWRVFRNIDSIVIVMEGAHVADLDTGTWTLKETATILRFAARHIDIVEEANQSVKDAQSLIDNIKN